ncbi:hypothetical protein DFH07DRAFT_997698 [Mycena maculata]|uniref:Uncharacterized protein n=1 Tax=Mycena maculata TaxID=230809 RepID=A0AAD7JWA8_9AGAR|nr:hypothetical protein DFH07DRAFT_997698 [Mycena maculata]
MAASDPHHVQRGTREVTKTPRPDAEGHDQQLSAGVEGGRRTIGLVARAQRGGIDNEFERTHSGSACARTSQGRPDGPERAPAQRWRESPQPEAIGGAVAATRRRWARETRIAPSWTRSTSSLAIDWRAIVAARSDDEFPSSRSPPARGSTSERFEGFRKKEKKPTTGLQRPAEQERVAGQARSIGRVGNWCGRCGETRQRFEERLARAPCQKQAALRTTRDAVSSPPRESESQCGGANGAARVVVVRRRMHTWGSVQRDLQAAMQWIVLRGALDEPTREVKSRRRVSVTPQWQRRWSESSPGVNRLIEGSADEAASTEVDVRCPGLSSGASLLREDATQSGDLARARPPVQVAVPPRRGEGTGKEKKDVRGNVPFSPVPSPASSDAVTLGTQYARGWCRGDDRVGGRGIGNCKRGLASEDWRAGFAVRGLARGLARRDGRGLGAGASLRDRVQERRGAPVERRARVVDALLQIARAVASCFAAKKNGGDPHLKRAVVPRAVERQLVRDLHARTRAYSVSSPMSSSMSSALTTVYRPARARRRVGLWPRWRPHGRTAVGPQIDSGVAGSAKGSAWLKYCAHDRAVGREKFGARAWASGRGRRQTCHGDKGAQARVATERLAGGVGRAGSGAQGLLCGHFRAGFAAWRSSRGVWDVRSGDACPTHRRFLHVQDLHASVAGSKGEGTCKYEEDKRVGFGMCEEVKNKVVPTGDASGATRQHNAVGICVTSWPKYSNYPDINPCISSSTHAASVMPVTLPDDVAESLLAALATADANFFAAIVWGPAQHLAFLCPALYNLCTLSFIRSLQAPDRYLTDPAPTPSGACFNPTFDGLWDDSLL